MDLNEIKWIVQKFSTKREVVKTGFQSDTIRNVRQYGYISLKKWFDHLCKNFTVVLFVIVLRYEIARYKQAFVKTCEYLECFYSTSVDVRAKFVKWVGW